jgi:hypothetical protein
VTGSRGKQRRLPSVLHQLICWPTVYQTSMPAFSPSQRPFLRDKNGLSLYFHAQHVLIEQEQVKDDHVFLLSLKLAPTPTFSSVNTTASPLYIFMHGTKYRRGSNARHITVSMLPSHPGSLSSLCVVWRAALQSLQLPFSSNSKKAGLLYYFFFYCSSRMSIAALQCRDLFCVNYLVQLFYHVLKTEDEYGILSLIIMFMTC